ncbi:type I methionyl aminopeptidase [Candidatus Gottesmanbacteria bacterium]|nr:type I methionyl aminopeptidase [Candidatus Gottesmanbacteria bacterium]
MTKQNDKITKMTSGGAILSQIMEEALDFAQAGVSTLQIEYFVREKMAKFKVEPSFTKVRSYQYYICACVNDVVVHGIPTDYQLQFGDILGLDIGVFKDGYHTDMSWSKLISKPDENNTKYQEKNLFLQIGQKALLKALETVGVGKRVGHISRAIQTTIEAGKYAVVKELVGHAVGKTLHEYPQIPGVLSKKIEETEELKIGMTLAIEVIYTMGESDIVYKNDDGWTIATKDYSLAGLFEVTVAITKDGPLVLTPFARLLNQQ